jgi:Ca2+-binding EF-hand superfamily protein
MGGIGMGMGMQDPNHAQQLAMQFQVFDTDGNGYLTANEVLAILMRSSGGNPLSMEDAQEVIAAFDTNGDGSACCTTTSFAMPCRRWRRRRRR